MGSICTNLDFQHNFVQKKSSICTNLDFQHNFVQKMPFLCTKYRTHKLRHKIRCRNSPFGAPKAASRRPNYPRHNRHPATPAAPQAHPSTPSVPQPFSSCRSPGLKVLSSGSNNPQILQGSFLLLQAGGS